MNSSFTDLIFKTKYFSIPKTEFLERTIRGQLGELPPSEEKLGNNMAGDVPIGSGD